MALHPRLGPGSPLHPLDASILIEVPPAPHRPPRARPPACDVRPAPTRGLCPPLPPPSRTNWTRLAQIVEAASTAPLAARELSARLVAPEAAAAVAAAAAEAGGFGSGALRDATCRGPRLCSGDPRTSCGANA